MASQYPRHRVAVVDGDKTVRDELESIISASLQHECVATCSTAIEAMDRLPRLRPDMALMDIDLPERSSIACIRGLKRRMPAVQIIMLIPRDDHGQLYESLAAGASGYLLKSSNASALQDSISEFQMFKSNMSSAVALRILKDFQTDHGPCVSNTNLSRIEQTILSVFAGSHLRNDFEEKLGMPKDTVRIHLHIIYEKLRLRISQQRELSSFYGASFLQLIQPLSPSPGNEERCQ